MENISNIKKHTTLELLGVLSGNEKIQGYEYLWSAIVILFK